ncbi:unnamed protein product [Cochlearia groenlandica]
MVISAMFPGFRFSPTDVELISYYLRRKIDGDENSVAVIAELDIYKFEPWDLPGESKIKSENEWFYFCSRGRKYRSGSQSRRTTRLGYWKGTGKERSVNSGNQTVGTKRTLVFHIGRASRGERTEWIMHEYCIRDAPQDALVVCRLRRNADFRASTSQKQMENGFVQDNDNVGQTSGSERDKKPYSVYEYGHCLSNGDIPGSSNVAEVRKLIVNFENNDDQDDTNDDCYAEILNDDIIKLDEEALKASQTFRPNDQTQQETRFNEASSSNKLECGVKEETKQTMNHYALFTIKNIGGDTASSDCKILNPYRIKKDEMKRIMMENAIMTGTTVLLAILLCLFTVFNI